MPRKPKKEQLTQKNIFHLYALQSLPTDTKFIDVVNGILRLEKQVIK